MTETCTYQLNKLVRDGIVQGHIDEGGQVDWRVLDDDDEFVAALKTKLTEEQAELANAATDEEREKEQRDIDDVLFALGRLGIDNYTPTKTFHERAFIITATLPKTSWLYKYYANDPARFPVVNQ